MFITRGGSESLVSYNLYTLRSINPKITIVSSTTISVRCVELQLIERRQLVVFVR